MLVALGGGPAWAHNSLVDASPAKNAKLREPPERVRLTFLQRVDPKALAIEVTDAREQPVPAEDARAEGKVASLAFVGMLANGTYRVTYRVVSLDGHPVQGSYRFTVDDAPASTTPAPPVGPSPAVPEAVAAATESGGAKWWPAAAGVAVIAIVAVGVMWVVRRKVGM